MSDKRDQITEAALKLFCENGFHDTSTAAISREAGVATGTLFLYFPVKDELIITLYIESKNKQIAFMKEGLSRQKTAKLKLAHIWRRGQEWAEKNPYAFQYMQMVSGSPYSAFVARKKVASISDLGEKFVTAAIKDGALARISLPLFFSLFEGSMTSTTNHISLLRSAKSKQKIGEQSFDIFWRGVSK